MNFGDPRLNFWHKARVDDETGCWLFGEDRTRYGNAYVNGRTTGAHRAAWAAANGPIPDGMVICHRCDTPACFNPEHLFVGTQSDNMRDRAKKGRADHATGRRSDRTASLYLRLTRSEKEAATAAAHREGVTLPAWLRFMVRRSVGMPAPGDAR